MSLRLYNSRTRAVEAFVPREPGHVRMYVCGLTPSAEAHLGHARSFMFFDVLRRYLTHLGYRVTYVRNVTDIDDRSIAAAAARGVGWRDVVDGYYRSFQSSMNALHVLEPDREPRATEYVPEIVTMIAALVERGSAYVAPDGVYFAVASFSRYGALSGRNTDELLVGARIAPDEGKRDPLDFALWKFAKPGEPAWDAPWGAGRPGWHIECSAMSHALLGEPLDIHGGGFDLIFPHHENEIAQTESLFPPPMANVWMHGGLLQFDGRKMSKSLGNFEPLSDVVRRYDPQAIRLLFLQTGYRKPQNFTESSIDAATSALRRLHAAYDAFRTAPASGHPVQTDAEPAPARFARRFFDALDDDVNTSEALAALFGLADAASAIVAAGGASAAAAFMHEALAIVGLGAAHRAHVPAPEGRLDAGFVAALQRALGDVELNGSAADPAAAIEAVIAARNAARKAKDYALADRLRVALADAGVILADSEEGTTWSVGA